MSAAFDRWVSEARAVPVEREIERRGIKLNGNGRERVGPCPKCGGDDRFSINTTKGVWNCRGCDVGGDVIKLVEHLDGVDFIAACTTLTGTPPPKANGEDRAATPKKIIAAEFPYPDETGKLEFATERIEYQNRDGSFAEKGVVKRKKTFRQKRPDPDRPGKWINNVEGCRVLPYLLPQLIEAIAKDHPVLVVEGEGKADLLTSWNLAATCNAGGAKKWKAEHASFLKDADVILVPDNDGIGWEHVNIVGASLVGIAKRIRVLVLPDLGPKGDVIDWAKAGGTREQLDELIARAPNWEPLPQKPDDVAKEKAERSEKELLDALAAMPKGIEFDRERRRLADQLDVSRSAIDAEIEARQSEAEDKALLYGHWFVVPWPEPVDGDSLIRDIIRKIRKHVEISFENVLAIALWVMFAWVHDEVATHSPILLITSPEPDSGKTTTLAIVSYLIPRAIFSVDISKGALYRSIQKWQPSFAIDEFDDVFSAKNDSDKSELRSVINSGHTRGQSVLRCITDQHKPELFPTFAPKAIGMIGRKMPPATLSRCVPAEVRRAKKGAPIVRFKHDDDPELSDLRSRLRRYSMDDAEALRSAEPSMPDGFENRRGDNWRLQFAIADLCSGAENWGDKARDAAKRIEKGSDSSTVTARLLAAIKAIFDSMDDDAIGSENLCEKLAADPGSEWAEWGKARKPITQHQLARMLKEHRIYPDQVRPKALGGQKQVRGYARSWFEDAWSRYL